MADETVTTGTGASVSTSAKASASASSQSTGTGKESTCSASAKATGEVDGQRKTDEDHKSVRNPDGGCSASSRASTTVTSKPAAPEPPSGN